MAFAYSSKVTGHITSTLLDHRLSKKCVRQKKGQKKLIQCTFHSVIKTRAHIVTLKTKMYQKKHRFYIEVRSVPRSLDCPHSHLLSHEFLKISVQKNSTTLQDYLHTN